MLGSEANCVVLDDAEAVAQHVARWLSQIARSSSGPMAVALSGGSTPKRIYEVLASPEHALLMPWSRVHLFWGDERFVPKNNSASNFGMVENALLSQVAIPPQNIHAMPTSVASAEIAAAEYDAELKAYYGATELQTSRPLFDVVLLGLGTDGHTASLFPGSPALEVRDRLVTSARSPQGDSRITLTYPAIESSRYCAFIACGAEKRSALEMVRTNQDIPATRLKPTGKLNWFIDRALA